MPEKPSRAADYSKEQIQLVKATCLYIATILGDYMEQVVIVGGLVPSILIDQENLPDGAESHVGTMDLDLGLTLAIFNGKRYQAITERLRSANFSPDVNEQGNLPFHNQTYLFLFRSRTSPPSLRGQHPDHIGVGDARKYSKIKRLSYMINC